MMKRFFSFDEMITPLIIKVLFGLGVAAAVITGLITIIAGLSEGEFLSVLSGLLIIAVGSLLSRVYCELLMVMFKIYDVLKQIRDK